MAINMNEIVNGIVLTKPCDIKPDKDSKESKRINLKVKFDGITLSAVFQKALSQAVIQWQNGQGRKGFDQLSNNQTVIIEFKAPAAAPQQDPMEVLIGEAKALGISIEELIKQKLASRL